MPYEQYCKTLAAAAVRGYARRTPEVSLAADLADPPLEALTEAELDALMGLGVAWKIPLYRFKRGHEDLPRVRAALGFLRGVQPGSLLDVGSGRGVFLFPFLEAFPGAEVWSADILPHRVRFLEDIRDGGVSRLHPMEADICTNPMPPKSVDVVSLLEVLEHIPDPGAAIQAAVSIARHYLVISVPSQPDNNPEHIHLLTKPILQDLFAQAGCTKLRWSGVPGHLILTASLEG